MNDAQKEVSQSVESSEYYRDALRWYGTKYHTPISQRAILIIISSIAFVIILMSLTGLFILLPLTETKPMIVRVPESLSKVASVHQLTENPHQDANEVVMEWFIRNFMQVREEYDIDRQQTFFRRVYVLSGPKVYSDYVSLFKSASSPTIRYERHTKRKVEVRGIDVVNVRIEERATGSRPEVVNVDARVEYLATEETPTENRKSVWAADITFRFSKIHVDQVTGSITPMEFKVTGYESKQLGLE